MSSVVIITSNFHEENYKV